MKKNSDKCFACLVMFLNLLFKIYFLGSKTDGRRMGDVEARVKVGITLYYMAHGWDGINLGCMSGLKNNSALKYLHQVTETICTLGSKVDGQRSFE